MEGRRSHYTPRYVGDILVTDISDLDFRAGPRQGQHENRLRKVWTRTRNSGFHWSCYGPLFRRRVRVVLLKV